MQNKCNNGCNCQPRSGCQPGSGCQQGAGQGFVPVNANWDFNCCDQYQQNHVRRNSQPGSGRRNNDCGCDEREKNYGRSRSNDNCPCEKHDDNRKVECCEQNTYIRQSGSDRQSGCDMDDCKCRDDNRVYGRSGCTGRDDCPCENCARNRNRNRSNGCEKDYAYCDGKDYNRGRSGDCGCGKDDDYSYSRNRSSCGCGKDNDGYSRYGKNRGVGMVRVTNQEIDDIFESESALRAGTLFPELHKPMNGYCPYDGNCGTKAQAAAFAAWELRLYLDTHPNDKEALAMLRKLTDETCEPNYATTFLPKEACTEWTWTDDPWPWKFNCKCGD